MDGIQTESYRSDQDMAGEKKLWCLYFYIDSLDTINLAVFLRSNNLVQKYNRKSFKGKNLFFFALLLRRSFSDHIYGVHFSHQHTYYKLQSFTCWTSVGSFHVLHLCLSFWLVGSLHGWMYVFLTLPALPVLWKDITVYDEPTKNWSEYTMT